MKAHLLKYIDKAKSPHVRGLRVLTEYFYATEIFEPIVKSEIPIVSVFGSARRKKGTKEYEDAKKLGALLYKNGYAVVTGASAGIMEAANEGVAQGIRDDLNQTKQYGSEKALLASKEFKEKLHLYSVGLKISLPFEPHNNPFVGVHATFHYFMVRKFFFGTLSSAFIACEGGWGTRDEMFEILTLVQTGKAPLMPVIYISPNPKHLLDDIKYTIRKKYISPEDLALLEVVSDYKKAVASINAFYSVVRSISYDKANTIDITLARKLAEAEKKMVKQMVLKQYKKSFRGVDFVGNRMIFREFNHSSYGIVRKIIDRLSGIKTRN